MIYKETYPVQTACQLLDYPRSSYYYAPRVKEENQHLKQAIQTVAGEWPTYAYRRITAQLNRQGWQVNHKHVCRSMRQMGIQRIKKVQTKTTTDSQHPYPRYPNLIQDLVIIHPDQVWASDITYIRLEMGLYIRQ